MTSALAAEPTERFFYHSFPRPRAASALPELEKGSKILKSICDAGLLMVPEVINWKQPTLSGNPRSFPVLQKRICFTELSPDELPAHSESFGHFALEFDLATIKALGAVPVFYVPQPAKAESGADAMGLALLAVIFDARNAIGRIAKLHAALNGPLPCVNPLPFNVGFDDSPGGPTRFDIDTAAARTLIAAVGHELTPWDKMDVGANAVLNFFYPADNVKHDRVLDYYRQREWRIACEYQIRGVDVMRRLTNAEREAVLAVDPEFFGRVLHLGKTAHATLDEASVLPSMGGRKAIELARRVIVPTSAMSEAKAILARLAHPPPLVPGESLVSN